MPAEEANCTDKAWEDCAHWVSINMCGVYRKTLRNRCRKSCSMCGMYSRDSWKFLTSNIHDCEKLVAKPHFQQTHIVMKLGTSLHGYQLTVEYNKP